MTIAPITPREVSQAKLRSLPPEVIAAFNQLIAAAWDGRRAVVKMNAAAVLIASKLEVTTATVYENKWLDVEDAFRKSGWKVTFDKPAYCETYDAHYIFEGGTT